MFTTYHSTSLMQQLDPRGRVAAAVLFAVLIALSADTLTLGGGLVLAILLSGVAGIINLALW